MVFSCKIGALARVTASLSHHGHLNKTRMVLPQDGTEEGRCKAVRKEEFKLPWREAGPPNHHDDKVDSDQQVVNTEVSLFASSDYDAALPKSLQQDQDGASLRLARTHSGERDRCAPQLGGTTMFLGKKRACE